MVYNVVNKDRTNVEVEAMIANLNNEITNMLNTVKDTVLNSLGTVKSVQRGTVTSKTDNNNIVVNINPINPAKSFVLIDIGGAPETTHQLPILLSLTETQVTFSPSYYNGSPTTHIKFSWQIIECY